MAISGQFLVTVVRPASSSRPAAMGAAAALIYPATLALLTNAFTDARERAAAIGLLPH